MVDAGRVRRFLAGWREGWRWVEAEEARGRDERDERIRLLATRDASRVLLVALLACLLTPAVASRAWLAEHAVEVLQVGPLLGLSLAWAVRRLSYDLRGGTSTIRRLASRRQALAASLGIACGWVISGLLSDEGISWSSLVVLAVVLGVLSAEKWWLLGRSADD